MKEEDNTDMVFDRNQGWKVDNENIKSDLLQAMHLSGVSYKQSDEFGNNTVNKARVRDTLYNHGVKIMAAEVLHGQR